MAIGFLGLAAKTIRGAKVLRGSRKGKLQSGKEFAQKVVGKERGAPKTVDKSQNPPISFSSPAAVQLELPLDSKVTTKTETEEGIALQIRSATLAIKNFLKGSLVLDKNREKERKKAIKEEKRSGLVDKLMEGAGKVKLSLPIPGAAKVKSLWESIKDFFITTLWGMVAVRLVPLIGKIGDWLPAIGKAVDMMINLGIGIVDVLSSAIELGYKAYDWTRSIVKKGLGEDAAKGFDTFMGHIKNVLQLAIGIGLAAAALAMTLGKGRLPGGRPRAPRGPVNQLRRTRTRIRRLTNPNRRALDRLKRLKQAQKQRKLAEQALKRQRFWRKVRLTNLRRTAQVFSQRALNRARDILPKPTRVKPTSTQVKPTPKPKPKPTVKPTPKPTVKPTPKPKPKGNVFSNILKWGKNKWTKWSTAALDGFGGMISGAKAWGAKNAAKLGNIIELAKDPKKLQEVMKSKLTKQIDDIIKNNKFLKNLMPMLKDPKKLQEGIKALLTSAGKSKGITGVKSVLEKAKAVKPKIGGIDALITGVLALVDYGILKESPINTLVKALSGLLGYAAGFAIGAPFGGLPGFILGAAGSTIGEWLGMKLLQGLAKTFPGLTTTEDPIMKDGRMWLRDPKGPVDHMVKKPEKTYTHRFDEMEGTFINDVRVSPEEYNAFLKMSEKERIKKYGVYRRGGERLSTEEIKQINNWDKLTEEQKKRLSTGSKTTVRRKVGPSYRTGTLKTIGPDGKEMTEEQLKAAKESTGQPMHVVKEEKTTTHKIKSGEIVVDTTKAGEAKNMLLAIGQDSSYAGIVDAVKKYAPYETTAPEEIRVPTQNVNANADQAAEKKKVDLLPVFTENSKDPYEVLYKGS